jgi:tellurite resistance protein TerC
MATNLWFWIGFLVFVLAMLALDLGVFHRTAHEISVREAAAWSATWIVLALLFAGGIYLYAGHVPATEFLTGYLIEKSLSIDNIFVIAMIFSYFAVPLRLQHRVLFWGILGALVMRGLFIALGAFLIATFHWIMYVFGALMLVTGIRMVMREEKPFDGEHNPVIRLARKVVPLTPEYHGEHFFVRDGARRLATPLFLALLLVEVTDILFAVDSIPAIFAVTSDTFLVFTSNVFAILGLRSLYFLLARMVTRFHLLRYGLAAILVLVGAKMALTTVVEIPSLVSLIAIAVILTISVVASWYFPRTLPVVRDQP